MTPTVERGLRAQICSRRGKRSDTGGDGFLLGGVMRRFEEKGGGGTGTAIVKSDYVVSTSNLKAQKRALTVSWSYLKMTNRWRFVSRK